MYFSRVQVDSMNRQKIKDLTHLGAYHNWVEQSFPSEIAAGERKRHLWRLDTINSKQYLLVLSPDKPDPEKLARYGVPGTVQVKDYDAFLNALHAGQTLRFRLTANPTHSVIKPGEKRGKVYPHVTVEQQRNWLLARAEKLGFEVVSKNSAAGSDDFAFDVVQRDSQMLQRKRERGARISRVTFEGLLTIKDLDVFKQTLVTGIGREKAFGMGLLTVIPLG